MPSTIACASIVRLRGWMWYRVDPSAEQAWTGELLRTAVLASDALPSGQPQAAASSFHSTAESPSVAS